MRMCLKCRMFYDDKVKFCLNDGVPLLNLDRTHDLWEKGTKALRETQKTVTRQIRKQSIKTTISTTVTTILTVMVISVVALNSYVYLNPEAPETEQPVMRAALLPSTEPTPAESPSPSQTPTPTPTPSPTVTPDTVDKGLGSNTNDNTNHNTNHNTSSNTSGNNSNGNSNSNANNNGNGNNSSSVCSAQEKESSVTAIYVRYFNNVWMKEIQRIKEIKDKPYGAIGQLSVDGTRATIRLSENCKQASIRIPYHGMANPQGNGASYSGVITATCINNGGNWSCR